MPIETHEERKKRIADLESSAQQLAVNATEVMLNTANEAKDLNDPAVKLVVASHAALVNATLALMFASQANTLRLSAELEAIRQDLPEGGF